MTVAAKDTPAIDYLYFSFVTITTTGYGDFTAASGIGRMTAVLEAIFGQLYLITVVALVVQNLGQVSRIGRKMEEQLQEHPAAEAGVPRRRRSARGRPRLRRLRADRPARAGGTRYRAGACTSNGIEHLRAVRRAVGNATPNRDTCRPRAGSGSGSYRLLIHGS